MSCPKTDTLKQLLLRQAPALQNATWAKHIQQCPSCQRECGFMQRLLASYQTLERETLSQTPHLSWQRMSQALRYEASTQRHIRHTRWYTTFLAAGVVASLVLGVFLTGMWVQNMGGFTKTQSRNTAQPVMTAKQTLHKPKKSEPNTQIESPLQQANRRISPLAKTSKQTSPTKAAPARIPTPIANLETRPLSVEETKRLLRLLQKQLPALPMDAQPFKQTPVSTRR